MLDNLSFEISIVYDDICSEIGFRTGFGFSALIYNNVTGTYLLFDTGGNGQTLVHNINKFNVSISSINKVIISHNHHDHAGGLSEIYNQNKNIEIYVPLNNISSFRKTFSEASVNGISEITELELNVLSSGQFSGSFTSEQCLILKLKDGNLVLLVGCAHPGLEHFIIKAKEIGDIRGIIGGFHGFRKFSYLEGIDLIGACHCTQYIKSIRSKFLDNFYEVCVGRTLKF
jgi:7,8-dihydropterin-6-yl-methyl-4-(beta-D-ribofuranosyl)aminobenzene 5'-phosphate synthase